MPSPWQIHSVRHSRVRNPHGTHCGDLTGCRASAQGQWQANAAEEALRHHPASVACWSPQIYWTERSCSTPLFGNAMTVIRSFP